MSPSLLDFLRHILDECNYILSVSNGKTQEQVLNDPTFQRSIVRSIEIIGEASKKLNEEFRNKYPQIEWKRMAKSRDKMIHHYFGIDYEIVWEIITQKIPGLQEYVQKILEKESDTL